MSAEYVDNYKVICTLYLQNFPLSSSCVDVTPAVRNQKRANQLAQVCFMSDLLLTIEL